MTEDLTAAISFATLLRQGGVRAQVYGEVKIKDMATGEQQILSPAQAVDTVAAALAQRAQGKPIREKD